MQTISYKYNLAPSFWKGHSKLFSCASLKYCQQKKKIILCSSYYLAAAISSQTVKHERGVTSGNHEAIMASKDHCIYFALIRSASPGFFCFSQTPRMQKSSMKLLPSTVAKDESLLPGGILPDAFLRSDIIFFIVVSM